MALEPLEPTLRVDWLAPASLAGSRPGRLGLTFLPGKHGPSERYPGRVYRRDLRHDLASLWGAGVRHLVLLVTDAELERWGDPEIVAVAGQAGIAVDRRPMADGTAPSHPAEMDAILASIERARDHGDVAVACMGGVGRTGMVAACALVAVGWDPDDAIAEVRRVRHPTAVETDAQLAFVRAYRPDRTGAHRLGSGRVRA